MLATERQNLILKRSQSDGVVRTSGLAEELGVAEETIRRDLDKLAQSGMVERVHGGASAKEYVLRDFAYAERAEHQKEEKSAVAQTAATVIREGETILLDASSTCLWLAKLLPPLEDLRVITYSLPVMEVLLARGVDLISLGGTYDGKGRRFGGMLTEQNLLAYGIDRFFFSAKGFDVERGASEANEEQAKLKLAAIRQASWSGLLVDDTKLGVDSSYYFCRGSELDCLFINDAGEKYFNEKKMSGGCDLVWANGEG